jgi:hypothetical protein
MCEVDSVSLEDPEDGITDEQAMAMVTAGYAPEEMWTWEKIWLWVFPDDSEVPDSGALLQLSPNTLRTSNLDA